MGALVLAGCSVLDVDDPERGARALQTNQTRYVTEQLTRGSHATYGFEVITTFQNPLAESIYFSRCFPDSPHPIFRLESIGGTVGSAYNRLWACIGHERFIVVLPGGTRVDTLHLRGPSVFGSGDEKAGLQGRFRLFYEGHTCPAHYGCQAPDSLLYSNTFEVRFAALVD